ncbi:MAG TPA: RNA polymerase sigma factor, partial [Cytophagales bacterium]|nr:RNA polymerase sigma factor [Cytophagales bacterium]
MITEKEYNMAVKEFTKNLYRYLLKSLRDEDAAKDLVQDCFMKLWDNRRKVDFVKVKSWLFSVGHNSMLNYIKTQSRKTGLDNLKMRFSVEQNYDLKELLEKGLSELSHEQKSIVLLRDLEGYNYEEIGEILQLNSAQVKVYLFRARQKLRDSIQQLTQVYE